MSPDAPTLHLTLVRHGATAWNEDGRWQGVADNPLGAAGQDQARRLAARLAGRTFEQIHSSDLARARHTAQLALPGPALTLDARLREIDFGAFDGLTVPQMQAHPAFAAWQADPWHLGPPGGESLSAVAGRMRAWADGLPGGRVIAFSHSVAIRSLLTGLFGWPLIPQSDYPVPYAHRLGPTSLTVLKRVGGRWTLHTLGDSAHLEG